MSCAASFLRLPAAVSPTRLSPRTGGRQACCEPPLPGGRAPAWPAHAAPACSAPRAGETGRNACPPRLFPGPGATRRRLTTPEHERLSCPTAGAAAVVRGRRRQGRWSTWGGVVSGQGRRFGGRPREQAGFVRARVCVHHAAQRVQVVEQVNGQGDGRAVPVRDWLCGPVAVRSRHRGAGHGTGAMSCRRCGAAACGEGGWTRTRRRGRQVEQSQL